MEISGKVYNVIYKNDENDFKIINIDNSGIMETVKGIFPLVEVGDNLECKGKYIEHKTFGIQFDCQSFTKVFPEETDDIIDYLSTGVIKGIGPKTAEKIVEIFKEDSLEIMYNEPEKLAQVKGISDIRAKEIGEEFRNKKALFNLIEFLKNFNLSMNNINRIYERFSIDSIEIIKENPYILIDILHNVSFKNIDRIALKQGISPNDEKRVIAIIKYIMNLYLQNGHTIVDRSELMEFVSKNIELGYEYLERLLHDLEMSEYLVLEEDNIMLNSIAYAESNIVKVVQNLVENQRERIKNYDEYLENYEEKSKINLTNDQRNAIKSINENNISIITGGPGTGKTTILEFIIKIFELNDRKVEVAAPTGKAAKRIAEVTGHTTSTIHRLLKIGKFDEDKDRAVYFEVEKLDADLLIIDEASMLDIYLFNYIVKALKPHTKLVIIGDIDQLPSVGPGKILSDLIESKIIPTIYLKEIFRQAKTSDIVLNAHRINSGKYIEYENKKDSDLEVINVIDTDEMFEELMKYLEKENISEFFEDSIILTPTKKGRCGTINLNQEIQKRFNKGKGHTYGKIEFKNDDRIMQIKNNYDLVWQIKDEVGTGVFNGETGKIINIDNKNKKLFALFDDGKDVEYVFSELDQLLHSYVMTIHKSQGSEFKKVILVLPNAVPSLLTRNILYTAISRAKENLIIISSDMTLKRMVSTTRTSLRKTKLKDRLINKQ